MGLGGDNAPEGRKRAVKYSIIKSIIADFLQDYQENDMQMLFLQLAVDNIDEDLLNCFD